MPSYVSETDSGRTFELVPAGVHVAICDMVVSLGVQPGSVLYPEPKHQHYIRWQIPGERIKYRDKTGAERDGPLVIGKTFTTSLNEKANLRKMLAAWRGGDFTRAELARFDLFGVLGKACQLQVIHTTKGDRTYANIAGVMPLPKGTKAPKPEGDLIGYSEESQQQRALLPEWLEKKIAAQIRTSAPEPLEPDELDAPLGEKEMPF